VFAGEQIRIRSFEPMDTVDDVRLWIAAELKSPTDTYDIALGSGPEKLPRGSAPLAGFGHDLVLRIAPRPKGSAVIAAVRNILRELSVIGRRDDDPAEFWRAKE
jgi:hypothetical protein